MAFGKVDIVHQLAGRYGYRRYLEIATPTTGNFYGAIDRARFDDCRRLVYRCPPAFDDGLPIDYRAPGLDIADLLAGIAAKGRRFEIMLVDPFHTYAASLRDLEAGFSLLEPGGAMIVHDCLPPTQALAAPDFIPGDWCGVTYRAFLDFVLGRADLRYLTVDADYGCGVVRKCAAAPEPGGWMAARRQRRQARLIAAWKALGDDDAAWTFFRKNRRALLNLIGVRAFRAGRHGLG